MVRQPVRHHHLRLRGPVGVVTALGDVLAHAASGRRAVSTCRHTLVRPADATEKSHTQSVHLAIPTPCWLLPILGNPVHHSRLNFDFRLSATLRVLKLGSAISDLKTGIPQCSLGGKWGENSQIALKSLVFWSEPVGHNISVTLQYFFYFTKRMDICLVSRDMGHLTKTRDCPAERQTVPRNEGRVTPLIASLGERLRWRCVHTTGRDW